MNIKKIIIITIGCLFILTNYSVLATIEKDMIDFEKENFKPINMNDVLDQSQEIFETSYAFGTYPTYYNINGHSFQSFIPQQGKLTRVEIYLAQDPLNPPVKNANLVIREGLNGENLTMASVSYTQIPPYGSHDWIEFDFPDIQVTVGQTYYIVCFVDWYPIVDSSYAWGGGDNDPYPNGDSGYSNDGGETWEYYSNSDFCFRTYGSVPDLEISGIKGGIGKISADIKNNLDQTIENIDCKIIVKGGVLKLINIESDIGIDILDSSESITIITDGFIFGLGPVDIEITAECDEVGEVTKTQNGFVFFLFVSI